MLDVNVSPKTTNIKKKKKKILITIYYNKLLLTVETFTQIFICKDFNICLKTGASIADTVCTDTSSNDGSTKPRAKRPRTCFTEDQIQILQSHFQREINPDSQAMEKIANKAGVHKRVAQVWFQNARARQKKEKGKKKGTKFSKLDNH